MLLASDLYFILLIEDNLRYVQDATSAWLSAGNMTLKSPRLMTCQFFRFFSFSDFSETF